MNPKAFPQQVAERLACQAVMPARPIKDLVEDVSQGLLQGPPRTLPPKYFYDARGSVIFDQICDTPEYYPTRTEDALLARRARDIVAAVRPRHIVELGAGTSRKTRRLFDACVSEGCHSAYAPFDVCQEVLIETGHELVTDYDWLTVNALVGDYHAGLDHLPRFQERTLFVFLGSTIGNFEHDEAVYFLGEINRHMAPQDRLLLGADRVKDPGVLHAAYNDTAGLTAEFNLNVLRVLNRDLDADFDPANFYHYAFYEPQQQQIEMHLVPKCHQRVHFQAMGAKLDLAEGESIRTEISRKFTRDSLIALLTESGFAMETHLEAPDNYFSLALAAPGKLRACEDA